MDADAAHDGDLLEAERQRRRGDEPERTGRPRRAERVRREGGSHRVVDLECAGHPKCRAREQRPGVVARRQKACSAGLVDVRGVAWLRGPAPVEETESCPGREAGRDVVGRAVHDETGGDPCGHRLRGPVGLEAAVPVDVVARHRRQHRALDGRARRIDALQLERRDLEHRDLVLRPSRLVGEETVADVPAAQGRHARAPQRCGQQRRGRRLAVRAGDQDHASRICVEEEFDLLRQRQAVRPGPREDGVLVRDRRVHADEVDPLEDRRVVGRGAESPVDVDPVERRRGRAQALSIRAVGDAESVAASREVECCLPPATEAAEPEHEGPGSRSGGVVRVGHRARAAARARSRNASSSVGSVPASGTSDRGSRVSAAE